MLNVFDRFVMLVINGRYRSFFDLCNLVSKELGCSVMFKMHSINELDNGREVVDEELVLICDEELGSVRASWLVKRNEEDIEEFVWLVDVIDIKRTST